MLHTIISLTYGHAGVYVYLSLLCTTQHNTH